jgi:hypothetical protein
MITPVPSTNLVSPRPLRHRRLLRARRERPGDCTAAEKRDELAPLHVLFQAQETAS